MNTTDFLLLNYVVNCCCKRNAIYYCYISRRPLCFVLYFYAWLIVTIVKLIVIGNIPIIIVIITISNIVITIIPIKSHNVRPLKRFNYNLLSLSAYYYFNTKVNNVLVISTSQYLAYLCKLAILVTTTLLITVIVIIWY